jgi:hypothetical protein
MWIENRLTPSPPLCSQGVDSDIAVKFNKKEFFLSMLYETLPPVIFSPLAAIILEGPTRAYHLVNHRLFLPIDKVRISVTMPLIQYL